MDGLGVGEVGSLVLRDRKHLAQEGSVSTAVAIDMKSGEILGVDITSRGFAYTQDTDELLNQCKELVKNVLLGTDIKAQEDWNAVKQNIRKEVKNFIFRKTKRSPMIIIQILEV